MSGSEYLIPLPWETRNLGVEAFGLSDKIASGADAATLGSCLERKAEELRSFFVQARVGMDTRSALALEQNGFYFVEATVSPVANFKADDVSARLAADPADSLRSRHRPADMNVASLDPEDLAARSALEEIAAESFTEDRFHVDHNCPREVADRRYVYWVKDLLEDPAVTFDILHLERHPIAFLARRAEQLLLGGFARRYVNAGLGDFFWMQVLRRMSARGLTRARTLVSVRNLASLNLHARLGFKFRDPSATFHYWRRARSA
jgi:RimJ/RimL family protein N-acetyltransferase